MSDDEHGDELEPPEGDEEQEAGLEGMAAVDVQSLYPGAFLDPATNAWIVREPGAAPVPNGKANGHGRPSRGVEYLRERLYTGNTITQLPPLEWLVDGLLFTPGQSVVYSRPKLAKTFWALDLACSISKGKEWMGRPVREGPVLYVAGEGVGGMGKRVEAWQEFNDVADLGAVHFLTTPVNLGDKHGMQALLELVAEIEPVLTIFDTLARCMPGLDENAAQDVGKVISSLDAVRGTDAHVMCLHHVGKDAAKGMRGSSALLGAVDTTIELAGDPHAIRCTNDAQKDAEPAPAWYASLTTVGTSAVIEPTEAAPSVSNRLMDQAIEALESLPASDRTASRWQKMAESAGMPERSFYRAKKELLDAGLVRPSHAGRGALYVTHEPEPEEGEVIEQPDLLDSDASA